VLWSGTKQISEHGKYGVSKMLSTITELREAARRNPKDANAANILGEALDRRSEHADAERYFRKAVALQPGNVKYLNNLATVLRTVGKLREAEATYHIALQLDPNSSYLNAKLGQLYFEYLNDTLKAAECYRKAILLSPDELNSYFGLSGCYIQNYTFKQGLARAESEIGTSENRLKILQGFMGALGSEGRYEEMRDCCQQILRLDPSNEIGLFSMAQAATDEQDFVTALHYHQESLRLNPDSLYTILPYLRYLLRMGNYDAACKYYRGLANRSIYGIKDNKPEWDGSSLAGKTILLDCCSGYGDVIQYARFAIWLKQRGAKVLFQSHNPICSLLETIDGVDQAIALYDEYPPYDYVFNATLIWLLIDVNLEIVGLHVPYLNPPAHLLRKWKAKIDTSGLKVGLCWQSSQSLLHPNHYTLRSVPFDYLRRLANVTGVTFFSLQKGFLASQYNAATDDFPIIDFTADHDFMDTAAITAQLDLVISVDTSIAHLAGALGKRTFLLLPYSAAWTWLLNRTDTPWYPTVRLFRQPTPNGWSQVIEQVEHELWEIVMNESRRDQ
jgi:tetratricopeptide (TPR) repeat protein